MTDQLKHISLRHLHPPKVALRSVRKTSVEFAELIESIRVDGVLQPLLVRPMGGLDYEVVEGEHRREAAIITGYETVPCLVREMSDDEAMLLQLKAQAVRPMETQTYEYARRLRKYLDDGMRLGDLSAKIDKSPAWIKKILKLNSLCDEAIQPVNDGLIPLRSAIALATLPMELQPTFIEDALTMKADFFVSRARDARVDYEAFLIKQQEADVKVGIAPKIRNLHDIAKELENFKYAEQVLEAMGAKTPMDGYKAALSWMLKIDPISIHHRVNRISEGRNAKLSDHDKQELRRKIVDTFVLDELKPGEPTNGQ